MRVSYRPKIDICGHPGGLVVSILSWYSKVPGSILTVVSNNNLKICKKSLIVMRTNQLKTTAEPSP
jgi:hypothetical protein